MYHTAYVSTWLTSPHGRSAVVYNVQAPTWVRADVFLPWDATDLGLYFASSEHEFYCDVGSSFVPCGSSEDQEDVQQVPTSLSIVAGTSSTTAEAPCTTQGGSAGCGVTRTFRYQVKDQGGQPMRVANMAFGDVICNTSTNQLNLTSYATTCGGTTGTCSGTAGPCGQFTDANGQFLETLTVCAPACKPSGTCTTAGQTIANQTWRVAGHTLSSDIKSVSYQCDRILVNGN